jgi:potassium-transporting ATPase ATP-binding subunit
VLLASLSDETPEGRSIVALSKGRYGVAAPADLSRATNVPFTAQTRISGVDLLDRVLRKGAVEAILKQLGLTRGPPTSTRRSIASPAAAERLMRRRI